ncbi:MAG: STAS domain-containing protein [Rickettsiales bacterium]
MSNVSPFTLPEIIDTASSEELLSQFRELFAAGNSISVDASKNESITTAGLQLLVSLEKSLVDVGRNLRIEGATDNFTQVAKNMGLEGLLVGKE